MNLKWNLIDPSDHDWIIESLKCLKTVSKKTANSFDIHKMQLRMIQKKMVPNSRPRTESMFEVWISLNSENNDEICMAVFLDRTLYRANPHDQSSVPARDIWCVTIGVAEQYIDPKNAPTLYSEIKNFLQNNKFTLPPPQRNWGVVWDAEVKNLTNNIGDLIFVELQKDIANNVATAKNADGTQISGSFPTDVKTEVAYNHFAAAGMKNLKMAVVEF